MHRFTLPDSHQPQLRQSPLGLELPPLESRQIPPPTPEQVWALIGVAKQLGGLGCALTYMGAFTGVRRNEALGLRFNDIEWFGNEVNVRHAISKRRGTDGAHKWKWHVGPPKSRKSLRRIAATESVMKMLADLKVGKPDGAFIFPGDSNGFIDPDKFDLELWKPIAEKAGMAGTRFHDLRHFFAGQLIAQGETAAYVRDQMGHSSIRSPSIRMGISSQAVARKPAPAMRSRWRMRRFATRRRPVLAIDGEEGPEGTVTN
jgi:integrase